MTRLVVLLVAIAAGSVTASAPQEVTFSARTESVRVDVLVTEGGRLVRDLGPADFEVRDNGVLQTVDFVSFQQLPLHIVLALDASASVAGERLADLRAASLALLDALDPDDRVSLLTFDFAVSRRSAPSDATGLRAVLHEVEPQGIAGPGGTALADATYAALMGGDVNGTRSLALVFSDGLDTGSWLPPGRVLDAARRAGVVVYGVSVRGAGGRSFLRDVSEITGGAAIEVDSTRNLRAAFIRVLEEFRNRYLVSYSPRGVPQPGWHRLDVRIKGRRATVTARPGYLAR